MRALLIFGRSEIIGLEESLGISTVCKQSTRGFINARQLLSFFKWERAHKTVKMEKHTHEILARFNTSETNRLKLGDLFLDMVKCEPMDFAHSLFIRPCSE